MNQEQVLGALRAILPTLLMYAATKGWITTSQVAEIGAAIVTMATAGWSIYVHTHTNTVAVVNAMPEVKGVITTNDDAGHELAAELPKTWPAGTADAAATVKP